MPYAQATNRWQFIFIVQVLQDLHIVVMIWKI